MLTLQELKLAEDRIYGEFPELRDSHSEFFKATSRIYRRAVRKNPEIKTQPEALYKAAEAAREVLRKKENHGKVR